MGGDQRFDVVIVGAGLVGLATAAEIRRRRNDLSLAVIEKESGPGQHQSSHNSGVLHSGVYYRPGSMKAQLCVEGKALLEDYAAQRGLAVQRCGKLVVAISDEEMPRLAELRRRAELNGVVGVRELSRAEVSELEPHVVGVRGLHVPSTGIIDFSSVATALASDVQQAGAQLLFSREVKDAAVRSDAVVVTTSSETYRAKMLVTCGGLYSDRIARMTGSPRVEIIPFRGDFYTLRPSARSLVRGLIYPVPDPSLPFLGVHFTRRIDGEVWAGPNAVLAFAREGYSRGRIRPREFAGTLAFPGFWKMARRHWRTGAGEVWRDLVKRAYVRKLREYVPDLGPDDLTFGPSGVRAQAVDRHGALVDDFVLDEQPGVLHVLNAPSPAATASLAIGRRLADRVFELMLP